MPYLKEIFYQFNQIFHLHYTHYLVYFAPKISDSHSNDIFGLNKYISLKSHTTTLFHQILIHFIELNFKIVCIIIVVYAVTNVYLPTYDYHCFVQSKFYLMEFWVVCPNLYIENNWDVTNILYGVSAEKRKMWIISVNLLHNIQLRWTFAIKLKLFYILCERDYG